MGFIDDIPSCWASIDCKPRNGGQHLHVLLDIIPAVLLWCHCRMGRRPRPRPRPDCKPRNGGPSNEHVVFQLEQQSCAAGASSAPRAKAKAKAEEPPSGVRLRRGIRGRLFASGLPNAPPRLIPIQFSMSSYGSTKVRRNCKPRNGGWYCLLIRVGQRLSFRRLPV